MSLFTYFGRNLIPHVFTDDISVIEICAQILVFISPFYLIYPVLEMLLSLTRSIKKIIIPTVITLIACLSRIVWIYFLPAQYSILEAKFSYPLSWIVKMCIRDRIKDVTPRKSVRVISPTMTTTNQR